MLTLNDGRAELWQWDTGRTLDVDADCYQVHFSNKVFGRSIDVDVVDGVAIIPDVLLQTDKDLNVWAFVGTAENGYTKISKTFRVNRRNKPADYVFTPVEQTTIAEIAAIAQSVRDDADAGRFDGAQGPEGPIGPVGPKGDQGETGPAGPKGDTGEQGLKGDKGEKGDKGDTGTAGADGKDGTSATHSWNGTVLTITSASGTSSSDLKGDKGDKGNTGPAGKDGAPGADGKTPEYGVDYGTPEQIAEIAQKAAAMATANRFFGVEFSGSTSAGTRTGAAKDFVFTPATDTSEGQNDFDAVYPWAGMRRCCCALNADGTVKVNAYKGQPGYIEDGTNGEVLVEVPLFYVKGMVDVDPQISMLPLPGFRAPRKFRNADGSLKQRCYLRAFPGYVGSDGKLHSVAGVVPSGNKTISAFLAAARQWGEKYCIETSADVEVMLYLMVVVYGTRNVQAKINGCVSLYATNIAITAAAESANTVTVEAGALQVGDVISIGTGDENESVAYRRIVTAVDGAVATFDGDPVTTTTDHKVWRIMQATGTANDVLGTCGSRVSNRDGKHSFIFYGLENPLYGNQWRFECDWKLIDGVPYYCDDPTKYQWTSATDYTKLDTLTLPGDGWAVKLQADERAPWLQITAAVGGSSGTYLSDYFYINKAGVRIVRRGADSLGRGYAGPFYVYLRDGASWSWWGSGGDLSIPG